MTWHHWFMWLYFRFQYPGRSGHFSRYQQNGRAGWSLAETWSIWSPDLCSHTRYQRKVSGVLQISCKRALQYNSFEVSDSEWNWYMYSTCLIWKSTCVFLNMYRYDMFYFDFFRASIFKVHLERIKTEMDKEALAKKMASLTSGFSGRHAHCITVQICTWIILLYYKHMLVHINMNVFDIHILW